MKQPSLEDVRRRLRVIDADDEPADFAGLADRLEALDAEAVREAAEVIRWLGKWIIHGSTS